MFLTNAALLSLLLFELYGHFLLLGQREVISVADGILAARKSLKDGFRPYMQCLYRCGGLAIRSDPMCAQFTENDPGWKENVSVCFPMGLLCVPIGCYIQSPMEPSFLRAKAISGARVRLKSEG